MSHLFRSSLIIGLFLFSSPIVLAEDWGSKFDREHVLEQLKDFDASVRRRSLARLADIGMIEDVPHMLRMLRDDDSAVRSMADQAITGLWLRMDNLSAKRLFVKAILELQNGNTKEAIELLDSVIKAEPSFSEAWNKRGDAWLNAGDLDHALADYEVALELNPYHYGVMQSCASIWMERSNARNAYNYLSQAMAINPNLDYLIPVIVDLEARLENDRI
ncbi:MAG: tetratricopeptide repeat protein [Proteobacteria bacterium]|nr:tetratricopeptide repeat protein [Pseudomonadota bacterium]MDA1332550.1 tetratricopeptide repeat protein [Pseudomonadota bacterium]